MDKNGTGIEIERGVKGPGLITPSANVSCSSFKQHLLRP